MNKIHRHFFCLTTFLLTSCSLAESSIGSGSIGSSSGSLSERQKWPHLSLAKIEIAGLQKLGIVDLIKNFLRGVEKTFLGPIT